MTCKVDYTHITHLKLQKYKGDITPTHRQNVNVVQ